ncbi:MAG: BatD family protein [Chitinophagaceae bacterium]
MKKIGFSLWCLFGLSGWLVAQSVSFQTQVNTHQLGLHETLQIQYVLQNASQVSGFRAPDFTGFNVVQQSQSTSSSDVNGQMSQSVTYIFLLQPTSIGRFTIAGATARVDGHPMESDPVTIQVTKNDQNPQGGQAGNNSGNSAWPPGFPVPGFGPPSSSSGEDQLGQGMVGVLKKGQDPMAKIRKNLFVKADVDKTKVYLGQQLTVTYKLYTRLNASSNVTNIPGFTGFSAEDMAVPNPPQATVEKVNGVPFHVFVIRKTMLFPLQSGTLTLDPVEVNNTVRLYRVHPKRSSQGSNDPFADAFGKDPFSDPFFSDPFGQSGVTSEDYTYNTKSPVVKITVLPLPTAGRPADFNGAVGKFTIAATLDKSTLSTDDAGNLVVTVTGTGNINLLSAPQVKFPSAFDSYASKSTDQFNQNVSPFSGSRSFSFVFMPKSPGDFTIPPVTLSYFDPVSGTYQTTQTKTFSLHVTQGSNGSSSGLTTPPANADMTGLLPIQAGILSWRKGQVGIFGTWWYWTLLILPLLALLVLLGWHKRQEKLMADEVGLKNRRANRIAKKRLLMAEKFLQNKDQKGFYDEVSRAIWGYLSQKLNIPFAELSREKVNSDLQDHHIGSPSIATLFNLLDHCELALYALSGDQTKMEETYREAIQIIGQLEEKLKK